MKLKYSFIELLEQIYPKNSGIITQNGQEMVTHWKRQSLPVRDHFGMVCNFERILGISVHSFDRAIYQLQSCYLEVVLVVYSARNPIRRNMVKPWTVIFVWTQN
jgi:hypothetical protein